MTLLEKKVPQFTICSSECCINNRLVALTDDCVAHRPPQTDFCRRAVSGNYLEHEGGRALIFQQKPGKAVTNKRLVSWCSDSKETVTVVAYINAAGSAMPPLVIAKGRNQPLSCHSRPTWVHWMQ